MYVHFSQKVSAVVTG